VVDAVGGKIPVQDYMKNETRFRMVEKVNPRASRSLPAELSMRLNAKWPYTNICLT